MTHLHAAGGVDLRGSHTMISFVAGGPTIAAYLLSLCRAFTKQHSIGGDHDSRQASPFSTARAEKAEVTAC